MGSSGSGNFTDYPGSRPKGKGNGAGGGGASGEDPCVRALATALEEVEHCDYFLATEDVPPIDTQLSIQHRGRLFAVNPDGQSIGALPTRYNYLADCLAAGFTYTGRITSSVASPVATVVADFVPSRP